MFSHKIALNMFMIERRNLILLSSSWYSILVLSYVPKNMHNIAGIINIQVYLHKSFYFLFSLLTQIRENVNKRHRRVRLEGRNFKLGGIYFAGSDLIGRAKQNISQSDATIGACDEDPLERQPGW